MMRHYHDEMSLYVAGRLNPAEKAALEQHLAGCPACRAERDFWQELSGEIRAANTGLQATAAVVEQALERIHTAEDVAGDVPAPGLKTALLRVFSLLLAQVYLVRRELWPVSAGVMALGVLVALVSNHVEAVTSVVPLVAAASLAVLFNPEYDAAYELALSTPTTPWKILLARLSVVSAFNLALALLASLAMLFIVPPDFLGMVILGWLAPMAFLSSLALLASLWISSSSAVALAYALWLLQFHQVTAFLGSAGFLSGWDTFLVACGNFWQSPDLLLSFSALLLLLALLSTRFSGRSLSRRSA